MVIKMQLYKQGQYKWNIFTNSYSEEDKGAIELLALSLKMRKTDNMLLL